MKKIMILMMILSIVSIGTLSAQTSTQIIGDSGLQIGIKGGVNMAKWIGDV